MKSEPPALGLVVARPLVAPEEIAVETDQTVTATVVEPADLANDDSAVAVAAVAAADGSPTPLQASLDGFIETGRLSTTGSVASSIAAAPQRQAALRWYHWPGWLFCRGLDLVSLMVLLAVVAAIPIVQLASLGYLLEAAGNLARGKPWRSAFPGLQLAGRIGTFFLLAGLLWLPVFLVTDLAYSAQLLQPDSATARGWRFAAFALTFAWVVHFAWSAMRGGRWWHVLWPAPVAFFRRIWRPTTWRQASDHLYETVAGLQFPRLWWLGARAAAAALLCVAVPVSMMIVGLRAEEVQAAGLVGLLGAFGMVLVMLYLPFGQIQMAMTNRFTAAFNWRSVRRRFRYAPLAHALAILALCALCLPLYLLRIEATPAELVWAPSLVFVAFMFPAKLLLGAAMGYAESRRDRRLRKPRSWWLRWPSRVLALASVLIYVGALYVAQLVAGQGVLVMYFQHALLVPAPLISS